MTTPNRAATGLHSKTAGLADDVTRSRVQPQIASGSGVEYPERLGVKSIGGNVTVAIAIRMMNAVVAGESHTPTGPTMARQMLKAVLGYIPGAPGTVSCVGGSRLHQDQTQRLAAPL